MIFKTLNIPRDKYVKNKLLQWMDKFEVSIIFYITLDFTQAMHWTKFSDDIWVTYLQSWK